MSLSFHPSNLARKGFTFVEAIFTIGIIGIMTALAMSAISSGARDANRIVARQQEAAVNEALTSYVNGYHPVLDDSNNETGRMRSLSSLQADYNDVTTTTIARFRLLTPNPSGLTEAARTGYIDQRTADHFIDYSSGNSDRLYSKALKGAGQYLVLPAWPDEGFPTVELHNE